MLNATKITRYAPADLRSILKIEREAFGAHAWPAELFREYAQDCSALFQVARRVGKVAGYSIARIRNRRAELDSIAVAKQDRSHGVATKLMARATANLKRDGVTAIFLMVRRDNHNAIRLYRQLGFVRTRTVPRYYEDGAAAWRMRKPIATD